MFTLFGALALVIAAVGLYGVLAYEVAQRRHEFGVRMALGAKARDVIRLVLGRGLRPVLAGMALGLVLAAALVPIRDRGHLDQVLLTLGLFFVAEDLVTIIWGRDFHTITPPHFLLQSKVIFGHYYPSYRLAVIVVGVVIALGAYLVFERTQLGAILRAAVEDRSMVAALGHNVNLIMLSVLLAGAALATFAGVIGGPIEQVTPGVGNDVLVLALIVVVVGGLGSIAGAFVASLIIGQVQSLGVALGQQHGLPQAAPFALFAAMALILIARPQGLFGK
jgi:branched-chain amino acid transport system permease protein